MATAIAVGLSIGVMYQCRCIHPPGGATAFTAVMGGQAIHDLGFSFILYPVLLNAVVMLILAIVINLPFPWRRYPAFLIRRDQEQTVGQLAMTEELHQNVLTAVRSLDSFVDVSEDDLLYLTRTIASRLDMDQAGQPSRKTSEVFLPRPTAMDSQSRTDCDEETNVSESV